MNPTAEERTERVVRKERTILFNFDTLYNDGYYLFLHYLMYYKPKLIPERGINIPEFTESEMMSLFLSDPYFHALVPFVPIEEDPHSEGNINDYYTICERLLSVKYNDIKSELFSALKTLYEIGELKIIGPTRSSENTKELAIFKDIVHESCTMAELMSVDYVTEKAKEWGASLVIHPYAPLLINVGTHLKDCGFMYPQYGYNYDKGLSFDRKLIFAEEMEIIRKENRHEFMEFMPFPIKLNTATYGMPKGKDLEDLIEGLRKLAIENGEDPDNYVEPEPNVEDN